MFPKIIVEKKNTKNILCTSKFQVFHIRRHHAAITMQRYIRGWVKRSQYLQAKDRTLRLQVSLNFLQNHFEFNSKLLAIRQNQNN